MAYMKSYHPLVWRRHAVSSFEVLKSPERKNLLGESYCYGNRTNSVTTCQVKLPPKDGSQSQVQKWTPILYRFLKCHFRLTESQGKHHNVCQHSDTDSRTTRAGKEEVKNLRNTVGKSFFFLPPPFSTAKEGCQLGCLEILVLPLKPRGKFLISSLILIL